ncbi:TlyA family RNA methyltransferase [Tenuibacillus multivorans]|uniref:23S rRNA (Cytidine1920-2'-O)/16S rRNA (Cytidine1409-2'-O)-methyltransferase n=1 Tax=Tenuibacillus multivorans TaxID=237069 RepID=A0A1G9Z7B4_9BACI|nr:TlyA family RNA methyltransferase [Tenuibacillus multivorans]GEL77378.1 TlyA family rRNA (cytidine-2'-O)-methyltransferase [Tenuibacillus multivorans]SDN16975.1 23S rRNA (cytidine1920-2'-O)/16S rRNA (cytidine1409-2'-O)-methyltransferase [Tenuibacillus multivorans]
MKKVRLDTLLVEKGFFESREKAKRSIMAGLVFHKHERLDKPGIKIDPTYDITVKGKAIPYVSRGGLKLEKALNVFDVDVKNHLVLDIGSSTGGFTDCALQNGARKVYAIDVGYNQLDWKLRKDPRVHVMERTNFRYVTPEDLNYGLPSFAVTDVSFISLKLIFPVLKHLLKPNSDSIVLIKPQFEAGRDQVGKKGIVRDPQVHQQVVLDITQFVFNEGYDIVDVSFSPITGGDGNIEFLLHARCSEGEAVNHVTEPYITKVIQSAHEEFHRQK